ncbi:MAG: glycosyltransferase family 2 protein [Opitutaceae bacterium]
MSTPAEGASSPFALSIVVPLYRSEATIARLVEALAMLEIAGGHEIVLVHDGSPDGTLARCRELMDRIQFPITLVDLARNFGEHNAVLAGLRVARGAAVVTMDDDLQNPPGEVIRLVEHLRARDLDCVYGVYREKKHSRFRNLGSRFTNWVSRFVLDKPRGLYLSSFRCLSAFLAREVSRYEGPFPYIDGLILQASQRIGSLEVEHAARTDGSSGYTLRKLIRLWTSMFVNFSVMPLRAATLLGFVLSVVGLLLFVLVFVEYFAAGVPARGWGSLMATILVFSGAQLVMLGLVGEYLGRLFLTVNRRPQSVVRAVVRKGEWKE